MRFQLTLTCRCNFNCYYCVSRKNNFVLNYKSAKEILDSQKKKGFNSVLFTGGEPFLNKDILKIVAYAKKHGFEVDIVTNGSCIKKKDVEKIKLLNIRQINISFHTFNEKIFELMTRINGSFSKVIKTLFLLKKYQLPLNINITVTSKNQYQILSLIKKLADNFSNLKSISLSIVRPFGRATLHDIPDIMVVRKQLLLCIPFLNKNSIKLTVGGIPLCLLRPYYYTSVELLDNGSKMIVTQERSGAKKCLKCKLNSICRSDFSLGNLYFADLYRSEIRAQKILPIKIKDSATKYLES